MIYTNIKTKLYLYLILINFHINIDFFKKIAYNVYILIADEKTIEYRLI